MLTQTYSSRGRPLRTGRSPRSSVRRGMSWFLAPVIGMCIPTAAVADDIDTTYTYDASAVPPGSLTVKVTTGSTTYDKLQIRCKNDDVVGSFATPTANWAIDSIAEKGTGASLKKFLIVKRSAAIASNQNVVITHGGAKRGGKGEIKVMSGTDKGFGGTQENSLLAVGACDLPNSEACACNVSVDECVDDWRGVYLGDGSACPAPGICVPALSEWGVAVMTLLVLTAATVVIMRRRAAVA